MQKNFGNSLHSLVWKSPVLEIRDNVFKFTHFYFRNVDKVCYSIGISIVKLVIFASLNLIAADILGLFLFFYLIGSWLNRQLFPSFPSDIKTFLRFWGVWLEISFDIPGNIRDLSFAHESPIFDGKFHVVIIYIKLLTVYSVLYTL